MKVVQAGLNGKRSSTILGNVLTRSAKEFNFFFGLRFGHQSYPVDL